MDNPPERPISIEVSETNPHSLEFSSQGEVKVYDMGLTARIPTQYQGSYLIWQILGRNAEPLIVSPDGGVACTHYFKPFKELRQGRTGHSKREGEDEREHTNEDTERFWLLSSDGFRRNLADAGWMIFPEASQILEYDLVELGIDSERIDIYGREFKITDFIRAMQLANNPKKNSRFSEDHSRVVKDFEELLPFSKTGLISYIWVSGKSFFSSPSPFFVTEATDKGKTFKLQLEDYGFERKVFGEPPGQGTLRRTALLEVGNTEKVKYLETLIRDYAKEKGINVEIIRKRNSLDETLISVSDRRQGDYVESPNTGELLRQTRELEVFVKKVVEEETAAREKRSKSRLQRKREKFGITAD